MKLKLPNYGLVVVHGKPGAGKTMFIQLLIKKYLKPCVPYEIITDLRTPTEYSPERMRRYCQQVTSLHILSEELNEPIFVEAAGNRNNEEIPNDLLFRSSMSIRVTKNPITRGHLFRVEKFRGPNLWEGTFTKDTITILRKVNHIE